MSEIVCLTKEENKDIETRDNIFESEETKEKLLYIVKIDNLLKLWYFKTKNLAKNKKLYVADIEYTKFHRNMYYVVNARKQLFSTSCRPVRVIFSENDEADACTFLELFLLRKKDLEEICSNLERIIKILYEEK